MGEVGERVSDEEGGVMVGCWREGGCCCWMMGVLKGWVWRGGVKEGGVVWGANMVDMFVCRLRCVALRWRCGSSVGCFVRIGRIAVGGRVRAGAGGSKDLFDSVEAAKWV